MKDIALILVVFLLIGITLVIAAPMALLVLWEVAKQHPRPILAIVLALVVAIKQFMFPKADTQT